MPTPTCAHFQTTEMPCLKCGKRMRLTLIEPGGHNFELRTYECIPCEITECILTAISAALVN
jgi:hypothetical protein